MHVYFELLQYRNSTTRMRSFHHYSPCITIVPVLLIVIFVYSHQAERRWTVMYAITYQPLEYGVVQFQINQSMNHPISRNLNPIPLGNGFLLLHDCHHSSLLMCYPPYLIQSLISCNLVFLLVTWYMFHNCKYQFRWVFEEHNGKNLKYCNIAFPFLPIKCNIRLHHPTLENF